MTTDVEIEKFLEHFGVKGMHWGVRKSIHDFRVTQKRRNLNKYGDKNVKPLTAPQKAARRERAGRRVLLGMKVAAGAAAVGIILAAHAHEKASAEHFQNAFRNAGRAGEGAREGAKRAASTARGAATAADIIHSEHGKQAASMLRMHQEGKMDAEQYKNFKRILDNRYARKLADLG